MAISLPVFNCLGDVWAIGRVPSDGPPDFTSVQCQFYVPPRGLFDVQPGELELWIPPTYVRTPVAAIVAWKAAAVWEILPGSGRYFSVRWKEIVHMNFPNEYHTTVIEQCDADGNPIFRDVVPPTPPVTHEADATSFIGVDLTSVASAQRIGTPVTHEATAESEISVDLSGEGGAENIATHHSATGTATISIDLEGIGAAHNA